MMALQKKLMMAFQPTKNKSTTTTTNDSTTLLPSLTFKGMRPKAKRTELCRETPNKSLKVKTIIIKKKIENLFDKLENADRQTDRKSISN